MARAGLFGLVRGEPVAAIISGVLALVNALTVLVTAFGATLTVDQTKAVYLVANAIGALVGIVLARRKVKPWPPAPGDPDVETVAANLPGLRPLLSSSPLSVTLLDSHPGVMSTLMGTNVDPVVDHPDFVSPPASSDPHPEDTDADDDELRPPGDLVELFEVLAWEDAVKRSEP